LHRLNMDPPGKNEHHLYRVFFLPRMRFRRAPEATSSAPRRKCKPLVRAAGTNPWSQSRTRFSRMAYRVSLAMLCRPSFCMMWRRWADALSGHGSLCGGHLATRDRSLQFGHVLSQIVAAIEAHDVHTGRQIRRASGKLPQPGISRGRQNIHETHGSLVHFRLLRIAAKSQGRSFVSDGGSSLSETRTCCHDPLLVGVLADSLTAFIFISRCHPGGT
jgi:hypothetical protein